MDANKGIKSIWFFVGLILLSIGLIVFAAGIYDLINPSPYNTRLKHFHTNIWWGAVIAFTGLIYTVKNRNKYITK